jgi:aldehyde:ferredoxin oxidoreductase
VRSGCTACTIGCEHLYEVDNKDVRLEYESLFALGSLCGVGAGGAVLRASQRCDEVGIDTIKRGRNNRLRDGSVQRD